MSQFTFASLEYSTDPFAGAQRIFASRIPKCQARLVTKFGLKTPTWFQKPIPFDEEFEFCFGVAY
jgi:hypothetical protein